MKTEQIERTSLLVGEAKLNKIHETKLLVVGLGGVGGMAVEMLARAGVMHFTLIDGDRISLSNTNRQILAFTDNVGELKTEEAKKRILRINPDAEVKLLSQFIDEEDVQTLFTESSFHFVLDCIDTVAPKVALLATCYARRIPIISSMGAGAKQDPTRVKLSDISKTSYCSLARVVRRKLKQQGIKKGIPVVYSTEEPKREAVLIGSEERGKNTTVGTISYLPNLFGCFMAAFVLDRI